MHGAFSAQVNALQSALSKLKTAVKGASSGSSSIADVRTAADEVTTATANLGTAFAQCGCIGAGTLIGQCWHFFAPGNLGRTVVTVTVRLCAAGSDG